MILSRFRRGLGPNPRIRASIDRAIPAPRVGLTVASARDVRATISVVEYPVDSAISFEARMARLMERVRARENSRQ
eukprot:3270266-Pyramimonas_sp.AAC.1